MPMAIYKREHLNKESMAIHISEQMREKSMGTLTGKRSSGANMAHVTEDLTDVDKGKELGEEQRSVHWGNQVQGNTVPRQSSVLAKYKKSHGQQFIEELFTSDRDKEFRKEIVSGQMCQQLRDNQISTHKEKQLRE